LPIHFRPKWRYWVAILFVRLLLGVFARCVLQIRHRLYTELPVFTFDNKLSKVLYKGGVVCFCAVTVNKIASKMSGVENDTDESTLDQGAMAVPKTFFEYMGPASTESNSLYRCLKCPSERKTISCHNRSRQNLKKHILVSFRIIRGLVCILHLDSWYALCKLFASSILNSF